MNYKKYHSESWEEPGSHLYLRCSMASLESRYVWHSQTGVYKNIPKESSLSFGIFLYTPLVALVLLYSLGAICQIRTDDLLITSELLYQLS